MLTVLAIDTSTNFVTCGLCTVSAHGEVQVLAQRESDNPRGHVELLTPNIMECLAEGGLESQDVDAVVVGCGPGPFTGLRVGMATAAAFADALGIPVHGVSSLEATAWHDVLSTPLIGENPRELLVLADARRREWYSARYLCTPTAHGIDMGCVEQPAVDYPAQIVQRVRAEGTGNAREGMGVSTEGSRVAAEGVRVAAERAGATAEGTAKNALLPAIKVLASRGCVPEEGLHIHVQDAHPTPAALVQAAIAQQQSVVGLLRRSAPLTPLYLRRPDAVMPQLKVPSAALDISRVKLEDTAEYLREVQEQSDTGANANTGSAQDENTVDKNVAGGGADSAVRMEVLTQKHAPLVTEIEQELFAQESPWSLDAVRAAIASPLTIFLGLYRGEELIGYAQWALLGGVRDPELELHTIAILPVYQGKGYGRVLLAELLDMADRLCAPIFLEVRVDNAPAVGLYRSCGFEVEGTRKGYYQPSGADAYTMRRPALSDSQTEQERQDQAQAQQKHDATSLNSNTTACADLGAGAGVDVDTDAIASSATATDTNPATTTNSDTENIILGIESSCDETGVGIIAHGAGKLRILSHQIASSMQEHARFGGVVPEIASRAHLESMQPVMRAALAEAQVTRPTAVAVTIGPGLAGALLVGVAAAKAYAAAWGVPLYAVNHLGGHVAVDTLSPTFTDNARSLDNAVALLVSGGHTQLLHVRGVGEPMEELGSTVDDAAGEAYDKVARLLGLGYPGGPIIDKLAAQGNKRAITFPRAMMRPQDARHDFSFSGLKTAVARYVENAAHATNAAPEVAPQKIPVEDVCASFQEAVADVLTKKALRACEDVGARVLLLGGGVSANARLRELAEQRCRAAGVELHVPPATLCTDNGVMIATLAAHLIDAGAQPSDLSVAPDPALEVEVPIL